MMSMRRSISRITSRWVITGLDDWRGCSDWVTPDALPNLPFFANHFAQSKVVLVADCNTREFTDHKRVEMTVKEFVDSWPLGSSGEDHPSGGMSRESSCSYNDQLYLKDRHFVKATWLECVQKANEIIFVPSGWYHQVHNMEDTMSINRNWFNANNLHWVWDLLSKDYEEARSYIEDIRNICDDFQRNRAANTGSGYLRLQSAVCERAGIKGILMRSDSRSDQLHRKQSFIDKVILESEPGLRSQVILRDPYIYYCRDREGALLLLSMLYYMQD